LKQSILRILDRLNPKKIVIVSSSPQIRYPDYYGIDMARMEEFIAFKAAIALLKERDMKDVIQRAYQKSKEQEFLPKEQVVNYVKEIYAPFTDEEIDGLHKAIPEAKGDWYFTGDYPTPGGNKQVNLSFINYIEQVYQF